MKKPAIVVVAYNRPRSLKRILKSIAAAEYESADIPLIISIDHGDNEAVVELANAFEWKHGTKSVMLHETNLGLKKHILFCGDMTSIYGSIIMLEDDLFVSRGFYAYACAALAFAQGKDEIGGISLYNHLFNVHAREPFEAIEDGYDNWYFQFASSWGQAWSDTQWNAFKGWYELHKGDGLAAENMPENVSGWSDKSWLKFYIKYMIETNRYFLYPRVSFSTNFFDEGTHSEKAQTDFQVRLAGGVKRDFCFSSLEESGAVYDAFFENESLKKAFCMNWEEITIDLYNYRRNWNRYYLTRKSLPFQVLKSFGCKLRPVEANILEEIPGNDIFLYDTSVSARSPKLDEGRKILYDYRGFRVKYIKEILKERLRRK